MIHDADAELLAGGSAQLLVLFLALVAVDTWPALADEPVKFGLAVWLVASLASTAAYFATSAWLSNQHAGMMEVEDVG